MISEALWKRRFGGDRGILGEVLRVDGKRHQVVGVVEPDAKRREEESGQKPYGGQKWVTEEELLATPGLQAVAVIITFCTGIVLVPSLTTSIFSGQGGQAAFPGLSRFMRR